jgi:triosephosphate isomerase
MEAEPMARMLVAGNWKMNGLAALVGQVAPIAAAARQAAGVEVALFPPFTLVHAVAAAADGLTVGGQDCHPGVQGPHTGCISAEMLADAGAAAVIVGHSERRREQGETDALVRAKAEAALAAGLVAIVCVGETEEVRNRGDAVAHVAAQVEGSVPPAATSDTLVVAYEPVWAVGTGQAASAGEIERMHEMIRAKLLAILGEPGAGVRLLYGGSVTGDNAARIMGLPQVDGVLVGGASLSADAFRPIIEAGAVAARG